MNNRTEHKRLVTGLRRELKERFYLWPSLAVIFAGAAFYYYSRIGRILEEIDGWEAPEELTADLLGFVVTEAMIPAFLNVSMIMLNFFAFLICLLELFRPRREARLLLLLAEKSSSQQISDGSAEKPSGVEREP